MSSISQNYPHENVLTDCMQRSCMQRLKNFLCVHLCLRKLWYASFNVLHLYVVIPVTNFQGTKPIWGMRSFS